MKAMIFAAGLGSRLKPLTDTRPKALVEVAGKTLLEHTILKLKSSGFDEIVINVYHFAGQIVDFLKRNNNFGVTIHISDETEMLLETGGGIKKAAHFFCNEPVLIHNVDILSDVDLYQLWQQHIDNNSAATLLVSNRKSSRNLLFKEGRLAGWKNNNTGEVKSPYADFDSDKYDAYAFSGIHVISPSLLKYMSEWGSKFSIIDYYLSICDKESILSVVKNDLNLIDVGKIDTLAKAEDFLKNMHK